MKILFYIAVVLVYGFAAVMIGLIIYDVIRQFIKRRKERA